MTCDICKSPMSKPVQSLFALPSITSDCRSWTAGRSVKICEGCGVMKRVLHPLAEAEFKNIYNDYKSYPEPEGRTRKILEFVNCKMPKPKSILDIGCGEGHGLKALEVTYPDSVIVGYEPHSKNPAIMHERPTLKYDLITLFHVLEHIEDVHEILSYVKSSLNEGGHVLIQVPYTLMWPFDLVLADHWWHFGFNSIAKLLNEMRFKIIYLGNDIIKKEITVIATPIEVGMYQSTRPFDELNNAIEWLSSYELFLNNVNEKVAIMGTGPAAAWAGYILGDKVSYYLDNDSSRIGIPFNERDVISPLTSLPVVAPFPDWQMSEIKVKNPMLRFL